VDLLREAIKSLVPGTPGFLIAGLGAGVVLLFGRPRMVLWGRNWLTILVLIYLVLSLQGVSDVLTRGLVQGSRPLRTPADASGARVVVVLSNGVLSSRTDSQEVLALNTPSRFNAIEGARVYRLLGDPMILASGGSPGREDGVPEAFALRSALEELGVPRNRIAVESRSKNTREQALLSLEWVRAQGSGTFVLVTTPEHIRRANGAFLALGARTVPSPSAVQYGGAPFWLPTGYALSGSSAALYEYSAVAFYKWRGWL
jgi:uncharacterized SAM-binding protein YcdF (DUF218 family)